MDAVLPVLVLTQWWFAPSHTLPNSIVPRRARMSRKNGAPGGTRTRDQHLGRVWLYPLSYGGIRWDCSTFFHRQQIVAIALA